MTCHLCIVAHDAVIADNAIMRKMTIGHDQAVIPDLGFPAVLGAPVNRYKFPDGGIVSNFYMCIFSFIFQILGNSSNNSAGKNAAVIADLAPSMMVTLLPIQVPSPISTFW